MKEIVRWLSNTFTLWGIAAIGLLVGGTLLFLWFLWVIEQARDNRLTVRAITDEQHQVCADMPRGSQAMESARHGCFKDLYSGTWTRI